MNRGGGNDGLGDDNLVTFPKLRIMISTMIVRSISKMPLPLYLVFAPWPFKWAHRTFSGKPGIYKVDIYFVIEFLIVTNKSSR